MAAAMARSRRGMAWALAAQLAVAAGEFECTHCKTGESFEEFLAPDEQEAEYASDVHVMWPTHVEVIPITSDNGGWEPPSFHEKLAQEAIRGWRDFQDTIAKRFPKRHYISQQLSRPHGGSLNDAFFSWQKDLFENGGSVEDSLKDSDGPRPTPPPDANSSWPQMNGLPEYQRLRKIVDKMSRRYLVRSGMQRDAAMGLNYSIFNWCAVHGPGEFHGPHTHVGEYHVGVFYAQVGSAAGKLRFGDPRGHSPPFGRSFIHTPRSGDLILFPSWLSHMATVTAPAASIQGDAEEPLRVVFSFNIGPVYGPLPCHKWWSDPTGDMRFQRKSKIDTKALGL